MAQIYLIPPPHCTIYEKAYCEGIYGESDFTVEQMRELVDYGCATLFDVASPHVEGQEPQNKRPLEYIGPVYTILARAEIWKTPWKSDEDRKHYFALRRVFGMQDHPYTHYAQKRD
jgi:hypothetical protein